MLIYSNEADGKVAKDTQITDRGAIEGYHIIHEQAGYVVYARLISGRSVILIVQPSYDQAVAVVEKIEREYAGDADRVDLRFLQLHPTG